VLRKICLKVASAETSCFPQVYDSKISALHGHCGAVATMIQATMGGDIVTGRINGIQHYWNRLPDGKEVDLTSCQFGGDGFTPFKKGRRVKERVLVPLRFLLFCERVREKL